MTDSDYRHLLDLARALRLAQKGNLARGIKPDPETAKRLEAAIDYFIAERDGTARQATVTEFRRRYDANFDGMVLR